MPFSFPLAFALASLSGVLYAVAFPGIGVWPLAFVALVPGIVALEGQTPKRAAILGLATGTALNVVGFYWLQEMLMNFSGFPAPLCAFFTFVVCTFQGGRMGLLGWLYARSTARGWPRAPMYLLAFAASELAYPLLFPWYYGASLYKAPVFTQIAELGGPILVSVLLATINMALAEMVLAAKQKRPVEVPVLLGAALFTLGTVLFGVLRIRSVDATVASADKARVGLVQGNLGLMQKREDPGEGLRRHIRLTRELKDKGVDFVVWSESSVTFPMRESAYKAGMRDYVGKYLGIPTIVGGVVYNFDTKVNRDRWYNIALSMDAKGEVLGRYDKQFLLAFGEYLPFGELIPKLYEISPNSGKFSPGTSFEPVTVTLGDKDHAVSVLICYEDILPRFTNEALRHGSPELIVNMTNDAWFGDTTEPWEHMALATFRSIEHRRYLVRSTNSGVSAVVDPVGRVIAHSGTFRAEALDATIAFLRTTTLYEFLGDGPWVLSTAAAILFSFLRRRRGEA